MMREIRIVAAALLTLLLACIAEHAFAESLVVQSCGQLPAPYPPGSTRYDVVDINGQKCVGRILSITGGLKTEGVPIAKMVDTFNSPSTLDANNFATPTVVGTGTATYTQGQEILNSGTTNNSSALLTSNPTFQINTPAYLVFQAAINAQVEIPGDCKQFGFFVAAPSPTCAAPVTDGILFEITGNTTVADSTNPGSAPPGGGKLQAVTYASGVRTLIADLSVPNPNTSIFPAVIATNGSTGATSIVCPQRSIPQAGMGTSLSPTDTCPQIYNIWFNGNSAEFDINGLPVAFMKVGSLGPNNNLLPWSAQTINTGGAAATTIKINQAAVGDEGRNSNKLCDPIYGFRCANVNSSGQLSTSGSVNGAVSNASSGVVTSSTNVPASSYNYWFNGTTWDQARSSEGDGATPTGIANIGNMVFNGVSWDRVRNAQSDGQGVTGMLGAAPALFNGTTFDRARGTAANGAFVSPGGFSFLHMTTSTTTTAKSGAGSMHTVCVNTLGTVASTITIFDNTAGSGTQIAVINSLALLGCQTYDVAFATGLTLTTTGTVAPDVTVSFR